MNVVYQLTYLDEDMGYYHIASSLNKSKLKMRKRKPIFNLLFVIADIVSSGKR